VFRDIEGSSATAPRRDIRVAEKPDIARSSNPPRRAVGGGSPLFFGDVLEHGFVEEKLGDKLLEAIDLNLKLATPAIGVNDGRVMAFSPAIIGVHGNAMLAADILDRKTLGQIAVKVFEKSSDFLSSPSLAHGSLPGKFTEGLPFQLDQFSGRRSQETGIAGEWRGRNFDFDGSGGKKIEGKEWGRV
jgi:hypothetical protein